MLMATFQINNKIKISIAMFLKFILQKSLYSSFFFFSSFYLKEIKKITMQFNLAKKRAEQDKIG